MSPITEVIMLTGHGTVETAIQGMKPGRIRLSHEADRHCRTRGENHQGSPEEERTGRQDTPGGGGTPGENEGLVKL